MPTARRVSPRIPPELLELAVALKKEAPGRTAAQVAVVLAAHAGWAPSARTLQRHFASLRLSRAHPGGAPVAVFGRFEAERPNARWVGDALHGPACAVLGITLTHSRPHRPAGRGKIERFFRTVRDQFLVEIAGGASGGSAVGTLAELNALFDAWVEQVYHHRVHSETKMAPLARFLAAGSAGAHPGGAAGRGFSLGRVAHGGQDRHGEPARRRPCL